MYQKRHNNKKEKHAHKTQGLNMYIYTVNFPYLCIYGVLWFYVIL